MKAAFARAPRDVALVAWCMQFVVLDAISPRLRSGGAGETMLFWGGSAALAYFLQSLGRTRVVRALVALLMATAWVVQAAALRYYNAPLDRQLVESAMAAWSDVRPVLLAIALPLTAGSLLLGALGYAALSYGRRPISRVGSLFSAALGLVPLFVGARIATPELRLLDAVRGLHRAEVTRVAAAVQLPLLPSRATRLPSVLFVLGESVRASDYCADARPSCPVAPRVNSRLPERIALPELRSIASYTAISVGAVLSGRTQLGTLQELTTAPTVFDFVHAVRAGAERPWVAYYSSQLASIFDRTDLRTGTDAWVTLEDLLGHPVADEDDVIDERVDRKVVDRFVRDVPTLPRAAFVVLHVSGTHAPYFVDPSMAPYQPWRREATWSAMDDLHRAYQNAIYAQDAELARAIDAFIGSRHDDPWVVVFTSDHGESFGEHRAIHHGQNLYDEQTHVPGYLAFGNGAIPPAEERTLRTAAGGPTTHLDIVPTILDLYGIWQSSLLGPYRAKMGGRSLLEDVHLAPRAVPITNCGASFKCPLDNWGMLGDAHALVGQPWDARFHCVALGGDSSVDVEHAECTRLRDASRAFFPMLPSGRPNR